MCRLGLIYIGINSVKLVLAEIDDNGYFHIIDELTSKIRLCYDLIEGNLISKENITETIAALRSFKSLCMVCGAKKIITVATEIFRLSENKQYFLNLIKEELDLDVKTLTSKEEINFNFIGVKNSTYLKDSLIVCICGSSTHIIEVKNKEIINSVTLPIGTVNLTYCYNLNDRILKENIDKATNNIDLLLENNPWITKENFDSIIAIGGTARAIGKIDRLQKHFPIVNAHQYTMSDYDLNDVFNILKSKDLKLRKSIKGLSPSRGDIIVGGALILDHLVKVLDITKITISGRGIREGILYDYVNNNFKTLEMPLDFSLYGIMKNLNVNIPHAENVFNISLKLFNELKPLHHLRDDYYKIIKTASLLHDCGISIDYYNHHIHSFYIILNSNINGLNQKELLLSASIASYHRNNNYAIPFPQYTSIINKADLKNIEAIGVILKISEGLDRSLEGAVKDFTVEINENEVIITLKSDLNLDLEIKQALRSKKFFKEVYSRDLIIQ